MKSRFSLVQALTLASTISMVALSSCTKKDTSTSTPPPTSPAPAAVNNTTAATAQAELTLGTDGDNLYFDKKELEAKAGQTVKITFKNNSSASSNMSHNWVLVKAGSEQQVATDGMQAGDSKDWVAEGATVLGHTKLAKPGETVSVTMTMPAAGDYTYICTYPGHSITMKGTLHVK